MPRGASTGARLARFDSVGRMMDRETRGERRVPSRKRYALGAGCVNRFTFRTAVVTSLNQPGLMNIHLPVQNVRLKVAREAY